MKLDTLTEQGQSWIEITLPGSKQHAKAAADYMRNIRGAAVAGVPIEKKEDVFGVEQMVMTEHGEKLMARFCAMLVTSWGFDEEPTYDNALKLFTDYPDLCQDIDLCVLMAKKADSDEKKPQSKRQKGK